MFNPNKWQPIIGHIARTAPSLQPLVPPRHAPFTVTRVHNPGLHTQGNSPQQGGHRQGPTFVQRALQEYGHPRNTDPSPSTGTPQKNISKRVDILPTPEKKQEYRLENYGRSSGFQQGHRPSPSTRPPLNPPPYNGAQRGDSRMSGPSVTPPSSQRRPMPIVNQSGLYPTPRQSAPVYPCSPFQPSPATRSHIRAEGAPPQRNGSRTSVPLVLPEPSQRSVIPSFQNHGPLPRAPRHTGTSMDFQPASAPASNKISNQMNTLPTPEPRQQRQSPSPSTRSPLNPPPYNGAQRGDFRMSGPSVLPPSAQRRPIPIVNQRGLYPTPRQTAPVYPSSPFQPSPATRPHIRAEPPPPQRNESRSSAPLIFPEPTSRSQRPSFRLSSPNSRNLGSNRRPTAPPFSFPVLPHLKDEKTVLLNPNPKTSVTIECESNVYKTPHLIKPEKCTAPSFTPKPSTPINKKPIAFYLDTEF